VLNGIPYLLVAVLAFWLGWKASAWWHKSAIKKATDVVGSAAQKPSKLAKSFLDKMRNLWSDKKDPNKKDRV
jgi:hypothetical protein